MDFQQMQLILGVFGLVQAIIVAVLWCIVYYHTKHRGGWFILALLPIVGMLVVPILGGVLYSIYAPTNISILTYQIVTSLLTFLCAVAPLFVLALRLMNGAVQVRRDADVFAGSSDSDPSLG